MPDWITASMFNNTTSYPLLLIRSLGDTSILNFLISRDESIHDAIERTKSYFLVMISPCSQRLAQGWLIASIHLTCRMIRAATMISRCSTREEKLSNTLMSVRTELFLVQMRHSAAVACYLPISFQIIMCTMLASGKVHGSPPDKSRFSYRKPSLLPNLPTRFESRISTVIIGKHCWYTISDRAQWCLLFLYNFLYAPYRTRFRRSGLLQRNQIDLSFGYRFAFLHHKT